jgi:carbonic anhydrase
MLSRTWHRHHQIILIQSVSAIRKSTNPHCGGEHQSPINIESNQAIIANYPEFIFHNYDLVFPERLVNNGHTDEQFDNIINPSTTNSDALKYSVPLSDLLPDHTDSYSSDTTAR